MSGRTGDPREDPTGPSGRLAGLIIMRSGPTAFGTVEEELAIGEVPVSQLAARVGSTPFFAYDRTLITDRVAELRRALPADVDLAYAARANPMPAVVQHLAGLVDSVEVTTAVELAVALDAGVQPDRITFTGPGKTPADLSRAVAAGATLEVESITEVNRVAASGLALALQPRIAIRIDPDFPVPAADLRAGTGGPPRFGVETAHLPAVLDRIADLDLELIGFHVPVGSQQLRADRLCETQRRAVELIIKLSAGLADPVDRVTLGGGFGIPYEEGDDRLDLSSVGENLAMLIEGPIATHLPHVRTVVGLGRFVVGEGGVYVTRVLDRQESRGRLVLVVDGGAHHGRAAFGHRGGLLPGNPPVAVGNRITSPPDEVATIVGRSRAGWEPLAADVALPRVEIDDLIVIFQAGAYGVASFDDSPEVPQTLVGTVHHGTQVSSL